MTTLMEPGVPSQEIVDRLIRVQREATAFEKQPELDKIFAKKPLKAKHTSKQTSEEAVEAEERKIFPSFDRQEQRKSAFDPGPARSPGPCRYQYINVDNSKIYPNCGRYSTREVKF